MKKTVTAMLLIMAVITGACQGGVPEETPPDETDVGIYSHVDMAEHVNLKMFLIGTKAEDSEIVMEALSDKLTRQINATLEVEYLPWSEYQVKYSLVLAGSEQIDMIFTGDWCFYAVEAAKGAFYELTSEFLDTYMPLTMATQNPVSLEQAKIGGKIYMMPSNAAGIEGESWFVIRGDLREKYGMEEITTREGLEDYFKAIVENEPDISPYAASEGMPFFHIFFEQKNNLNVVSGGYSWITKYVNDDDIPAADDILYRYFTPEYAEFASLMKQYADSGFWSKSAISNTTQVRDSFEKGKSASLVWNQTIFLAGEQLEKNNDTWKAEYIDLYPGTIRRATLYTNGGTAIAAFSKNPERAAMCIDLLKCVPELNDMIKGGIESIHWIDKGGRLYEPGPASDKYEWNHAQWAFNTPFDEARVSTETTQFQIDFENRNYEWIVHPTYENFRFNREPVNAEWAAVEALEKEYQPILELGITDDPLAAIEEFRQKLTVAGFEKVEAEFITQFKEWAAAR